MPEMDGCEVQTHLNQLGFSLPVIVITGQGDIQTAEAALANSGHAFRDQEMVEAAGRLATFSRREREVLDAVVAGRQSKVIAHDLGLSVRTVEVHRARMLERLGVRRHAEAVRLAVLAGLAPETRRTVR
jgi:two-component system, LuxR family, response regulator FixJ